MAPALSVLPSPSAGGAASDLPPIDALFLIDFDVKKGYTIVWKRTSDGVEVDGRVEYKSLPSGLHTVTDDLIYFVHDGAHAGLSAFVNMPCDEEDARNARMIAVGVLVPLSYGRLGRAWRHAPGLKELAVYLAKDRQHTSVLEQYWDANKGSKETASQPAPPSAETPLGSPAVTFSQEPQMPSTPRKGHNRTRSASDGGSLVPSGHKLSPYHPAWSLTRLLDQFGPLIFPIHRAALLRQRILISCHAPVHEVCDFVYNLSVLSNIPLSLANHLPTNSPTHRLRPLFAIGVHDVPFLMEDYEASKCKSHENAVVEDEAGSGWIACTTDSILAMKDTLWDMLITMPPEHATHAKEKVWPVVEYPRGNPVKATQRDLRRFNALRNGLVHLSVSSGGDSPSEIERPRRSSQSMRSTMTRPQPDESFDKVAEPLSWSAFAYNGYMWWASAGEQLRSEEQEESARDAALLADLSPGLRAAMSLPPTISRSETLADSLASLTTRRPVDAEGEARIELAIIAYFHRLTTQMLSVLADVVDAATEAYPSEDDPIDGEDDDGQGDSTEDEALPNEDVDDAATPITVDSRSVENMGLDVWSRSDAEFVQDLTRTYFGRKAKIEGKGVEVCGVRVC